MYIKALNWQHDLISQYLSTARIVGPVISGTPAHVAKIEAGWLVLCIDEEPADIDAVILAYSSPAAEIVFFDPVSNRCYHLTDARMPLGCDILPVFNGQYDKGIRAGTVDAADFLKKWEIGDLADFSVLKDAFETILRPSTGLFAGRFVSDAKAVRLMLDSANRWGQLGLALAHLSIGNFNFAHAFARAYFENLKSDQGAGDSVLVTGAALFVLGAVLEEFGDNEGAATLAERSLECTPGAVLSQQLYSRVKGTEYISQTVQMLGQAFPVDYRLNRFDPYSIWPHLDHPLTLPPLLKGQKGLICLLGAFRSNGPYLEDLHRLMADTICVRFIHVISSWKGDPNSAVSNYRREEESSLMLQGLQLEIGFDPSDEMASVIGIRSSPTWFVIAQGGIVEAIGQLTDAAVLTALFERD